MLSNWSSQDGWLETKIRLPLLQEKFFSKQTSFIIPRLLGILKNKNIVATAKIQLKTKPVFLKRLNSFFISCHGALETSSGERPKYNSSVSSRQGRGFKRHVHHLQKRCIHLLGCQNPCQCWLGGIQSAKNMPMGQFDVWLSKTAEHRPNCTFVQKMHPT